jgi:hypothetical protein
MATTTLTLNPQKITLPDTNENDINFDTVLGKLGGYTTGYALIDEMSAATQFSANGEAIAAGSGSFSTGSKIIPITRGIKLRYKGSNGATFNITIVGPS